MTLLHGLHSAILGLTRHKFGVFALMGPIHFQFCALTLPLLRFQMSWVKLNMRWQQTASNWLAREQHRSWVSFTRIKLTIKEKLATTALVFVILLLNCTVYTMHPLKWQHCATIRKWERNGTDQMDLNLHPTGRGKELQLSHDMFSNHGRECWIVFFFKCILFLFYPLVVSFRWLHYDGPPKSR